MRVFTCVDECTLSWTAITRATHDHSSLLTFPITRSPPWCAKVAVDVAIWGVAKTYALLLVLSCLTCVMVKHLIYTLHYLGGEGRLVEVAKPARPICHPLTNDNNLHRSANAMTALANQRNGLWFLIQIINFWGWSTTSEGSKDISVPNILP